MWSSLLEPRYRNWPHRPTNDAGEWVPLDRLGVLAFSGTKRNDFLQGYFTRNLDHLQADRALFGATCDIQGRITCNGWLLAVEERTLYRISADLLAPAQQALAKYAPFTRTTMEPTDWLGVGLLGTAAEALGDAPLGSTRPHAGGILLRTYGRAPRYELWMPPDAAAAWVDAVDRPPAATDAWQALEIEAGIATVTASTTGRYLPQQLGMNELEGIDFDKGCYLGQEIVARLQYRGRAKRHLLRLDSDEAAADATTLFHGEQKVGEIVLSAALIAGRVALAVITSETPTDLRDEHGALWRAVQA